MSTQHLLYTPQPFLRKINNWHGKLQSIWSVFRSVLYQISSPWQHSFVWWVPDLQRSLWALADCMIIDQSSKSPRSPCHENACKNLHHRPNTYTSSRMFIENKGKFYSPSMCSPRYLGHVSDTRKWEAYRPDKYMVYKPLWGHRLYMLSHLPGLDV